MECFLQLNEIFGVYAKKLLLLTYGEITTGSVFR